MQLFPVEEIKKFYSILDKMGRGTCGRYKGYSPNNPDWAPCEKDVFVKRTVGKWLNGKSYIIYHEDKETGYELKRYITIGGIRFAYAYNSTKLDMWLFDYSKPEKGTDTINFTYNDVIDLEGREWKDIEQQKALLQLFEIDLPEREFVFKAYRLRKCRGKRKEIEMKFNAKTLNQAYKLRNKYNDNPDKAYVIHDLIEAKTIN